jgi:hypothetical protein
MEASRTDIAFKHRVKRADGMILTCIWTGHIVRDHLGKAVHVLGTVRAISTDEPSENRSAH